MPAGLEFPRTGTRLWVPMELDPNDVDLGRFGTPSVARLLPGVSLQQTSARLAGLLENLAEVFPDEDSAPGLEEAGLTAAAKPLQEYFVGDVRQPLAILLASVSFILLIACANVANLFLVRADGRDREMAVRAALGASRGRIVRSFLTESCLLGIAAGAIGLLLAYAGLRALVRLGPSSVPRLEEIGIDATVLIFTFVVSLLAGALFGLLPAFRAKPAFLSAALKEGGRAQTVGRGRQRARNTLVGAQVALAVVLLVGSGLMVRTYQTLTSVDLGFEPDNVLTFRLMLPTNDYPGAEAPARFVHQVVDEIGALPGVQAAGAVHHLPLGYSASSMGFIAEDSPRKGAEPSHLHVIKRTAPGFFETLQIPLLAGRTLEWADQEERRAVVVVSEAVANEYWPGQNPIGKRIQIGDSSSEPDPALWLTIVGVVGNLRNLDLEEENGEIVYLPLLPIAADSGYEPRFMGFVVRGHGDPTELVDSIRATVQRLDPNLPLANVETMQYLVEWAREDDTFLMTLLLVGAGGALLIGAVGIYGVVSYVVSQRTHEIGVRMALGARTSEIGWMVLRRSLLVTMSGVVAGVAAALILSSFMRSLLYGVAPVDPVTFTAVPVLLMAVALLATWLPARRAARTDPLKALRFD
jgi:putative ABC transport system permease protein